MRRLLLASSALACLAAAKDDGSAAADPAEALATATAAAVDLDPADLPPFAEHQIDACMCDLVKIDVKLREEGISLASVLAIVVQNTTGIDIR